MLKKKCKERERVKFLLILMIVLPVANVLEGIWFIMFAVAFLYFGIWYMSEKIPMDFKEY